MIYSYLSNGYLKTRLFSRKEFKALEDFAVNNVIELIKKNHNKNIKKNNLIKNYHLLNISNQKHSKIFRAENRHTKILPDLKNVIFNTKLKKLLSKLIFAEYKKKTFKLWDEKYGNIAFRIVRPFSGDGYPFTKKEWGPAGKAISIWIPILGFNKNNTIKFISGSNKRDYEKYLPSKTKFIKNEFRLNEKVNKKKITSLNYKKGEVLIFSPKLLHSEDNNLSKITRLNLEFRIK